MAIGHNEIVVSDSGNTAASGSSAMGGYPLANRIVMSDAELGGLITIGDILGWLTQAHKGIDTAMLTDSCRPRDDGVGADPGSGADLHIGPNNREGLNAHIRPEDCLIRDLSEGMNHQNRIGFRDHT